MKVKMLVVLFAWAVVSACNAGVREAKIGAYVECQTTSDSAPLTTAAIGDLWLSVDPSSAGGGLYLGENRRMKLSLSDCWYSIDGEHPFAETGAVAQASPVPPGARRGLAAKILCYAAPWVLSGSSGLGGRPQASASAFRFAYTEFGPKDQALVVTFFNAGAVGYLFDFTFKDCTASGELLDAIRAAK